eukprot:TRINITY_DN834_c0_g6_i1.p1 TRINITY_DN834_c0_g6~~TRINITY_DN834_c0_g6_i1.p1  ORF type:complete len:679 (+),score=203.28 TRINITY_DN834_c0_g6_i1:38-2074(+)
MEANMETALLAWVRLFDGCKDVTEFKQLSSGVHLVGIFSEMHPKHAVDEREVCTSSNWVLQEGNLELVVSSLDKVYRRFPNDGVREGINKIDTAAIAEKADEKSIITMLKFLLTSMFVSSRAEELGAQITPLTTEEETKEVPEVLMSIMTEVQETYDLDPTEILPEEEDEEVPSYDGYSPPTPPTQAQGRTSLSHVHTAADYEAELASLKETLKSKDEELTGLEMQNRMLREEAHETNVKYQLIYDKQFTQSKSVQEEGGGSKAALDKLKKGLEDKNDSIAELENKLQEFRVKEEEWIVTSDELQIAQHELAEARKEVAKVEQIREQREKVTQERNFYKSNMDTIEAKLTEEIQKSTKLQAQCDRAEQKAKKAEETEAEKLLIDVQLSDLQNKLNAEQVISTTARSEATAAQNRIRQLTTENNSLKEELEIAGDAENTGGNLADELVGQQGRDEILSVKKELITVKGDLEDKEDELQRMTTRLETALSSAASKDTSITSLSDKVKELTHLLAETQQNDSETLVTVAAVKQVEDQLCLRVSELRLSESKVNTLTTTVQNLETEITTLKNELGAVQATRDNALKQKVKLESDIKTAGKYSSPQSSTTSNATKEKEKKLKQKIEDIQKQSKTEMEKLVTAFYSMGASSMQQQMNTFNKNQQPSSWLAKTKHQAHSFTSKQP